MREANTPEGMTAIAAVGSETALSHRYDWTTQTFVALPPAAPMSPPPTYTFNEWVDRFPFAAQVAIVTATTSDPVAKLIYDRALVAGISGAIDPADPRTIEGVEYLVSRQYITAADADQALGR